MICLRLGSLIGSASGSIPGRGGRLNGKGSFSQEASLYVTYISGGKYENRNEVYLLKTAEGKFVKIQFYDYVNERLKGGYPSFPGGYAERRGLRQCRTHSLKITGLISFIDTSLPSLRL